MDNDKVPVRIRMRSVSGGRQSLYLDIYDKGKRRYEFLRLYLLPSTSREARDKNRETMALAEAVRAKRIVEIRNRGFGFDQGMKDEIEFLEYFKAMCLKRKVGDDTGGTWGNWSCCLKHLETYCSGSPKITFRDIDKDWVDGFRDYLDKSAKVRYCSRYGHVSYGAKGLSDGTKESYFAKLVACLNQAVRDGIITRNPAVGIGKFKGTDTERCYLTMDEVRAMAAAECRYPVLKRAFLFSCLTGIRKSDIEKMRWDEIHQQGNMTRIIFTQKKTRSVEYLDISPEAVRYMGDRGNPGDRVFDGFNYGTSMLAELRMWAMRAGISKDVTFHTGRHTFAVLMLDLGADIYTVQKLLGHKEIKTTEIYAKLLDKKKQAAVLLIPKLDI